MLRLVEPEPLPMEFELVDNAVFELEPTGLGLFKPVYRWTLEEIETRLQN
jgi:hypothetical protein